MELNKRWLLGLRAARFSYISNVFLRGWRAWQDLAAVRQPFRKIRRRGGDQFRQLVENSPDLVMILEKDSTISYVNPCVSDVLGYAQEEFVETAFSRYLQDPDQAARITSGEVGRYDTEPEPVEVDVKHADGTLRHLEIRSAVPGDGTESEKTICYARDITARAASERDLFHRAFHDHLTSLPNKALFMERLEHVLSRFPRYRELVAVLFVDLDNFKAINDRYGHQAGDRALVAVGQRLKSCLRHMDTAARLHGDEFAVLVENVPNLDEVYRVCERLLASLGAPVGIEDDTIQIAASIGIVLGGQQHRPEALLQAADDAMYRAKAEGKSCYALSEGDIVPEASGVRKQSRRAPSSQTGSILQQDSKRFAGRKQGSSRTEYSSGNLRYVGSNTVSLMKELL